jgi:hyperosmotically inducible periplasmic protein
MKFLLALASSFLLSTLALAQQAETKAPGPGEATPETKQKVSNAGLTGKVKSALAADVGMKTLMGVTVDSANGVVTLKGHVDSEDTKKRAEAVAKKVDGVTSVKNQLKVEKPKG